MELSQEDKELDYIEKLKLCAFNNDDDELNELINDPKFIEYFNEKKTNIKIDPLEFQKKIESEEYQNIFKGNMGHARLFVDAKQDVVKLINSKKCYIFSGSTLLWEEKDPCFIVKMIQDYLTNYIMRKINEISSEKFIYDKKADVIKNLSNILNQIRNYDTCERIFKNAKSDLIDTKFEVELDTSSNELPIIKGRIIDMKTKKIRNRQRTDLFTFEINCDYLENNELINANRFFNDIMLNNKENITYLQFILGYSFTCETKLRSLFIFYGEGSNGKSVLLDMIQNILGKKMCKPVDKRVFIKSEISSGHSDHLAQLQGARIAIHAETEDCDRLNESQIKTLTGSDEISTRKIYESTFTFKPFSKYFIITNHKPIFNLSQSMIERIKYIPFDAHFVHELKNLNEIKIDDIFIDKLKTTYLSEVFTFIINGAYEYYKNSVLKIPEKIEKITNDNLNELDSVSVFIKNRTQVEIKSSVKKTVLYTEYKSYCETENHKLIVLGKTAFYKALEKKKYVFVRLDGYDYVKNISLVN